MEFRITHRTEYLYEDQASLAYNEARLTPRSFWHVQFTQQCHRHQITIEPASRDQRDRLDFFGNSVLYFTIPEIHTKTVITAVSDVTVSPMIDVETQLPQAERLKEIASETPAWETVRDQMYQIGSEAAIDARQFAMASPMIEGFPELAEYTALSFPPHRPILEGVIEIMDRIYEDLDFVPGVTTVTTPIVDVFEDKRGVCQDYAHLMIGCLRSQGLAARYVSGYIETLPPPGEEKLTGADASHAWCSVYIPDLGWADPTNNPTPGAASTSPILAGPILIQPTISSPKSNTSPWLGAAISPTSRR